MNKIMYKDEEISQLIAYHGEAKTLVMCMEECAELIQAVSKLMRYGLTAEVESNLIEELADVTICMAMIRDIAGIRFRYVDEKIKEKMQRNVGRIRVD